MKKHASRIRTVLAPFSLLLLAGYQSGPEQQEGTAGTEKAMNAGKTM